MSSKLPQEPDGSPRQNSDQAAIGCRAADLPDPQAIDAFCQFLRELEVDPEVDWDAFVRDHADHADDLALLLAEYERVTAILERLTPAASFSARLRQHYGDGVDPGISLSGDARKSASASGSGSKSTGRVLSRLSALNPNTGRYDLVQEIARGGMGAIMEVWDRELRRTLAMKVVLGGKAAPGSSESSEEVAERRLSRFLEEAQITGQLDHPGIVPVHDIGIDESARVYFTMQLIDGHDLRKVFEMARMEKNGWDQARVISVFVRVCEAMAYAHSKNVVHRDLKPANIMVGAFGEAYVMDWGLAKVLDQEPSERPSKIERRPKREQKILTDRSDSSSTDDAALMTLDGDIVGTPSYMAPEQAHGKLDEVGAHSDIYSIGAMLYHLFSGHAPYEPLGEKVAAHVILDAVRKAPPWPLQRVQPDVDGELAAICGKAMSRDPSLRYESMMALGDDLGAWVAGRGVGAYTSGLLYETRKWMSRNRATSVAIGTIAFLMAVSVALFIYLQQYNFGKLEDQQAKTLEATEEANLARGDADRSAAEAQANESAMKREKETAETATLVAKEQKERADQLLSEATLSQEEADDARKQAQATAYRSSINAAAFSLRLNEVDAVRLNLRGCPGPMRGWEWEHLNIAADPSIGDLIVAGQGVTDLAVAMDGKVLLTYGLGRRPRLWKVPERNERSVEMNFPGIPNPTSASFHSELRCAVSPDGRIVAVTNPTTNSLRFISAISGDALPAFEKATSPIMGVAFSADGSLTGTVCKDGTGWIFLTSQLRVVCELRGHVGSADGLAFSPDGRWVATCGADMTARICDAATGEEMVILKDQHTAGVVSVDWSPDSARVVTSSDDGSLAVWNATTGAMIAVMHGHRGRVRDAVFGHDGEVVYSAGEDRTVRMWVADSGRQSRVFNGHESDVRAIVSLGNTGGIASVDLKGTVRCWDRRWNPATTVIELPSNSVHERVEFGPGNRLIYGTSGEGQLKIFDADLGTPKGVQPGDDDSKEPAESRYLTSTVALSSGRVAASTSDSRIEIFSGANRELSKVLDGFTNPITRMAISADGRTLFVGGRRRNLLVIDLETDTRKPIVLAASLSALALSSDGKRIVTADADETLRVWDAAGAFHIKELLNAHSNRITDLAISSDGKLLSSASNDGTARVWTLPGLEAYGEEFGDKKTQVTSVAFSPTESRLATGGSDGQIRIWSLEGLEGHELHGHSTDSTDSTDSGDPREVLFSFPAHAGAILDLGFSADGTRLVSSGDRSGVKIWESASGTQRYEARYEAE